MALVVLILKAIMWTTIGVMVVYATRHALFTLGRLRGRQRLYYQDIIDSDLPFVTVLVPMHNEGAVAADILAALADTIYPSELFEVIPINDHSDDNTGEVLDEYAELYSFIRPLHRTEGPRGKPPALNEAMRLARGEIIVVFDADYLPARGLIRDLAVCFKDPEIGGVMGRVIPMNTPRNLLTRLLDMERSGGYQVDQQARYNFGLVPQYGGTVGGFRKDVVLSLGGFHPHILTEDTELTFNLFVRGWKVIYANRLECYEESPEEWRVRARQIRRWAMGHTQTMLGYMRKVFTSPFLNFKEKMDGALLLFVYMVPIVQLIGILDGVALFFLGEMTLREGILFLLFVVVYNTFGNLAPFYQIAAGSLLDGGQDRIKLLPFFLFNYVFNMWTISGGVASAIVHRFTGRWVDWRKTRRYRKDRPSFQIQRDERRKTPRDSGGGPDAGPELER